MKIGLSFGRCVRDIVKGDVNINDVLVVIARTLMEKEEHVDGVIQQYMWRRDYLMGLDEEECKKVGRALFSLGKLHQPRVLGAWAGYQVDENYVWMDAVPTLHNDNDLVKKAWNNYQMALKLASERSIPDAPERGAI